MAQIFISHSKDDLPGKQFLLPYFSASNTKAYFYGWESPDPPHAPNLKKQIQDSVAIFVLMSDHLNQNFHTAAWTSYEVGLAHAFNKPVLMLEAIPEGYQEVPFQNWPYQRLPVAHVDYWVPYNPNITIKSKELQEIIISAALPTPFLQFPLIVQTLNKYLSKVVLCGNELCKASFRTAPDILDFVCPSCRMVNLAPTPDGQID